MNRFLFVCTGNTCRSPMAAALMTARLAREQVEGCADSAGLSATGSPAAENAVAVMEEQGIDLTGHRSRPATRALCEQYDVIAVMSPVHRMLLMELGVSPDKITVLAEADGGIPDPYGGDMETYRASRDRLAQAVAALPFERS